MQVDPHHKVVQTRPAPWTLLMTRPASDPGSTRGTRAAWHSGGRSSHEQLNKVVKKKGLKHMV